MRIALHLLALILFAAPAWSQQHVPKMNDGPQSVEEIPLIAAAAKRAAPGVYEYVHEIDMWLLTVQPMPVVANGDDLRPSERLHWQLAGQYNRAVRDAHAGAEARERSMIQGQDTPGSLAGAAESDAFGCMRTYYQIDHQRLIGDIPKKPVAAAAPKPVEPADPDAPPPQKVIVTVHHKGDPVDP